MAQGPGFQIFFRRIYKQIKQNARAPVIQGAGVETVVPVKRPEIVIAFQRVVMCLAEQRPGTRDGFAGAARYHNKGIRPFPFMIFLPAIIHPREERPQHGGRIALGRAQHTVKREVGAKFRRVVGADAGVLIKMDRPERKKFVITGDGFNFPKPVGLRGYVLVFSANQRPELPAVRPSPWRKSKNG